ncbi:MAG: efflux RND transporter permease subunit [Candidatus Methylomirabilis oxygeniifera]|uniref:Putative cation/multidrug efflux pump of the AcrB/AcrD/AcrF family n=1 Tax=Methylomirabilis oxygeniifera TaxID=671143 RepID=D5MGV2_METO1|nr:MAG: efflux RND transporter permease subunit [Candidatus Methylomirabilis oxyfera]CBE68983.1 putative cation/multidrug efflux pump of the AcrB/AcrD/AcrF family [Candidatus Methylomirabilis oxyfera]
MKASHSLMEAIVRAFVDSKLTPLIIVATLLLGAFAILATPREEEPQIIVPMMDVFVEMPGTSTQEVEERVTIPMEKTLTEIPGVEYIYSTSMPGMSMAVVRFYVGQDEEDSIVKLYNKLYSHLDLIPPGASQPLIKPRSIDDVPILALTLWSDRYDHYTLRRVAAQIDDQIKDVQDISETTLIGGQRRQLRIVLDPTRMAAFRVDPTGLIASLQRANQSLPAGSFARGSTEYLVKIEGFVQSAEEVGRLVIGAWNGRPVYLQDVAEIQDSPEEVTDYVLFTPGAASATKGLTVTKTPYPAVTIAVAKRKGTNAVTVAERVLTKVESLKGQLLPSDLHVTVTRNYGDTAQEKSSELLEHLLIAVISVTILIALFLGGRAALVVLIAVPVTLALTLFIYYLYGYTLNRVTLFALIFSIGLLVDDPIVDVENIVRHYHLPENRGRSILEITVEAVNEVRSPLILATFAVVFAILPMAFVRGLMGPYMRPIPVGSSTAMLFSMIVAFVMTPWAAYRLLRQEAEPHSREGRLARWLSRFYSRRGPGAEEGDGEGWTTQIYRRIMTPLILNRWRSMVFLGGVGLLLVGAVSLLFTKVVRVKMLPFDNKSEFQIIIDMPEGTALEETAHVARAIGDELSTVPEVTDYTLYIGTASPYNFTGLVRHYFLRKGPNVADFQVNLLPKGERSAQSHEIAKAIRPKVQAIAGRYGARVKVAEVPPGPPVLQTLVAEVYGPDYGRQIDLARTIRELFEQTPGVVDVDWYVEDPQPKYRFVVDKEKAALNGIPAEQIVRTVKVALDGMGIGLLHLPKEKEDVPLLLRLSREKRSSVEDLKALKVASPGGTMVPLSELVRVEETTEPPFIYRKNLKRVVYVTGDVAGAEESPVYAILKLNRAIQALSIPEGYEIRRYAAQQPFFTGQLSMKWDGEWQITYEVFRDLGLAFAAVLILIYILVVAWFQSFKTPLVILAPIPLSLIGILPAHGLLGAFFTATSMIGFIAGAGIVVRNSIILVDFTELRRQQGMPLADAVIEAGAVRFRPMLLTASAVVVGSAVILFDPIFQGLAISLMAGEVASTFLSRMAVPILYYLSERGDAPALGTGAGSPPKSTD